MRRPGRLDTLVEAITAGERAKLLILDAFLEKLLQAPAAGDRVFTDCENGRGHRFSDTRCLDRLSSGDGAPGLVRDRPSNLNARKQALERALAEVTARAEAMAAIRRLIDRVEVGGRDVSDRIAVTPVGAPTGLLSCAQRRTQNDLLPKLSSFRS